MSRPSTSLVRTLLARPDSVLRPRQAALRSFSTTQIARDEPVKVPVALISKVRSARPGTPLTLARSALAASNNDVPTALEWIAKQTAESGAKKAEKLAGREAQEGVVAVAVLADGTGGVGVRASLVEMRCETDFVARTDEFRELAEGIARSLAFFAEPTAEGGLVKHDVKADALLLTPVVPAPHKVDPTATAVDSPPETVKTSLAQIVSRLGENIHLSRASSVSLNPSAPGSATFLASSYLHASKTPSDAAATGVQSGALGGLLIARLAEGGDVDKSEVKGLLRALARQVVAMPTTSVRAAAASAPVESGEPSTALYEQSLITLAPSPKFEFEAGSKVGDVLKKWSEVRGVQGQGLEVVELARWELGADDEGETA